MSKETGAIIVGDLFWGDGGKGKVSGFLNASENAQIIVRAGVGPNAEHGIFLNEETYIKVNQLPLGWMFNRDSQIRIGSGVALNPQLLLEEITKYKLEGRVKVDYRCPIITKEHIQAEIASEKMSAIGSTFSGSGFCRADFVLRKAKQAKDIKELNGLTTDVSQEVNLAAKSETVIIESSQGTYLSLALSPDYPLVTSDNVTTGAVIDDVGLNWQRLKRVVMILKTLPTREGAGPIGSPELSEEQIISQGLVERSSIGGVIRRKASCINWEMAAYACELNGATEIALTFCDHYDPRVTNVRDKDRLTDKEWRLTERVRSELGIPVTIVETGKPYDCILNLQGENPDWVKIKRNLPHDF